MGLYFAGSIVKPIRQISSIASKFAMGDFSVRIDNNSGDEIGDLCTAINNMADELSATETMKNEFISSVSHELRTPLTAIKGWAETLMIDAQRDPATTQKGVGVILNEAERLSQMVEELLDFSRMQSGHFTLQRENMDVLAELGDAVLIYSDKARRENISIIYNEPEMLPMPLSIRLPEIRSPLMPKRLTEESESRLRIRAAELKNPTLQKLKLNFIRLTIPSVVRESDWRLRTK